MVRFLKFITGYVVEESLSVDNVFVIAMLFRYFAVPRQYQHRVLFWGILGAVAMRGLMIAIGAQLVVQFAWILYVFGGILIVTAIRMAFFTARTSIPARTSSSGGCGGCFPSPTSTTVSTSSSRGVRPAGC